ncbi:hypothetical protein [Halomicrobium katesii]|uniref:hypothetical protein n=1 Tax=Halomicrobium katesii TaxID=437163 RepID=UPI00037760A1|nr:hypothetical protein [Halomicrobium katesii]
MPNRRTFLLTAGSLATVGATGAVTAQRQSQKPTTDVVGEAFHQGLVRNGSEGATRALEGFRLEPSVEATREFQVNEDVQADVEAETNDTATEQDVEPEYTYNDPENSDSELVVGVSDAGGDEVWVAVGMTLEGLNRTIRNSWWCDDAIGIGYINGDWAPVGEPSVGATERHSAKFTSDDVAQDALAGTVDIVNHNDFGAAAGDSLPSASASLTAKFRLRDDGEPSTIWGSYTHTFAGSPTSSIQGISGGAGGLSVNLSLGAANAWSIAHPTDPADKL